MRICQACENKVAHTLHTCSHCGSDLTGQAEIRAMMANRSTTKALLAVAVAVGILIASVALITDRALPNTPTVDQRELTIAPAPYTSEIQYHREQVALHGLNHRSFTRHPARLKTPFVVLNQIDAAASKAPVYKVLLRPGVYSYDQMHDLSLSLAKNHPGKSVKVQFWTGLENVDRDVEDYGFTLTSKGQNWNVRYSHNI